jgi:hypothetical protein
MLPPAGQRTWRLWAIVGGAIFLLLLLWAPHTSIPSKSKEYIDQAWSKVTGGNKPAAAAAAEEAKMEQMGWATANETGYDFDKCKSSCP